MYTNGLSKHYRSNNDKSFFFFYAFKKNEIHVQANYLYVIRTFLYDIHLYISQISFSFANKFFFFFFFFRSKTIYWYYCPKFNYIVISVCVTILCILCINVYTCICLYVTLYSCVRWCFPLKCLCEMYLYPDMFTISLILPSCITTRKNLVYVTQLSIMLL